MKRSSDDRLELAQRKVDETPVGDSFLLIQNVQARDAMEYSRRMLMFHD